jgi:hypothetical protein
MSRPKNEKFEALIAHMNKSNQMILDFGLTVDYDFPWKHDGGPTETMRELASFCFKDPKLMTLFEDFVYWLRTNHFKEITKT